MVVIYAEKASLAKAIAVALHADNRIAYQKEPTIGHYEFTPESVKLSKVQNGARAPKTHQPRRCFC